MLEQTRQRSRRFQALLAEAGIDVALVTDQSSITYLAGFWGYLSVEFGRPTLLVMRPVGEPVVITPSLEHEMVSAMTWVERVVPWTDSGPRRWETALQSELGPRPGRIAVESDRLPAIVRNFLDRRYPSTTLDDVSPILGGMRTIKSTSEIDIMRQAGRVGTAMMAAAEASLAEGLPEYEAALAIISAGTRTAAALLTDQGWEAFVSPLIHNLQIMQSGRDTSMVHRRANVRRIRAGDPVYFCMCNMVEFKQYKLGFDRMFFLETVSDEAARVQQAAIDAQRAAIDAVRPGVTAESVADAANAVYASLGYETGYRTGRSIGVAYLESPELKTGDRTVLEPGMTFAVDGGVSVGGELGGRIGDSVVVTAGGCEFLTDYPRDIRVVRRP